MVMILNKTERLIMIEGHKLIPTIPVEVPDAIMDNERIKEMFKNGELVDADKEPKPEQLPADQQPGQQPPNPDHKKPEQKPADVKPATPAAQPATPAAAAAQPAAQASRPVAQPKA